MKHDKMGKFVNENKLNKSNCLICGKEFIHYGVRKYCGNECWGKSGNRIKCDNCGKEFKRVIGPKTYEIKCPKCGEYDVDVIGNPLTKVHPLAIEAKKKWKEDTKAGHGAGEEYWAGAAGAAYLMSNPYKCAKCRKNILTKKLALYKGNPYHPSCSSTVNVASNPTSSQLKRWKKMPQLFDNITKEDREKAFKKGIIY